MGRLTGPDLCYVVECTLHKVSVLLALLAINLSAAVPKKPRLIPAIVIDQFRYEYLDTLPRGISSRASSHGSPFVYDSHVPIRFHVPVDSCGPLPRNACRE